MGRYLRSSWFRLFGVYYLGDLSLGGALHMKTALLMMLALLLFALPVSADWEWEVPTSSRECARQCAYENAKGLQNYVGVLSWQVPRVFGNYANRAAARRQEAEFRLLNKRAIQQYVMNGREFCKALCKRRGK